jgi:ABC-type transporter Mla subunit MlaD
VSPLVAFTWNDLADLALAVFLFAVGLSLAYAFVRLGGTLRRISAFIKGAQDELLPVINKTGGTVDRVNAQLDKLDVVTDSAVDAADSVDTAVRAVSFAIQRPVQKIAGVAAGVAHATAAFRVERDWRSAVERGKEAAARRESELEDELRRADEAAP